MSSTDPMKDDSWILSETMRRISLLPFRYRQMQNTKLSSLTKQITQHQTYNSAYGLLLRSLLKTADSSSPANYKNKIIQPLHSRCVASLNFRSSPKTHPQLAANFFQRIKDILDQESVKYDPKVIVELINKYFPDWRRVLNELQRYSVGGKIDAGILAAFSEVKTNDLVKHLKEKNFPEVRKWVVNNLDNDPSVLIHACV